LLKLALLFVSLLVANVSYSQPQRVVSINLCADELLLLLADPSQIVSLSYLSQDEQYSSWSSDAAQYPVNYAGAEEIIALQPDLVLAGQFSDPMVLRLFRQQGIKVVPIKRAQSLAELFDATLQVGNLLGHSALAVEMVAKWKAEIELLTVQNEESMPSMAMIGPNGYTEGRGTLRDQLLMKAGLRNVASDMNMVGNAEFSIEQLLVAQPDLLAIEDSTRNRHSLAQRLLQHPALQGLSSQRVTVPASLWSCPGPSYVVALQRLVAAKKQWWAES